MLLAMEQHKNTPGDGEAERPRVPIKTYKWEDIRRDKIKGGYPWTYLNKEPFDSEEDYHNYLIMEQKKFDEEAEGVLIAPIVEGESTKYVVITEPLTSELDKSQHSTTKQPDSEEELNLELDEPDPVVFTVESAESSDNISQYLDKEENPPTDVPSGSTIVTVTDLKRERAKSEEPKLKRKLSIDSSYSRKSLSKLGILKKLKEAKEKLPKLHLPKLPTGLKPKQQQKVTETTRKEVKKTTQIRLPKYDENPVYIHIPLNPPDVEYSKVPAVAAPPSTSEEIQNQEASLEPLPIVGNGTGALDRRFSGHPDEIVAIEILKTESIDLEEASKNGLAIEGGQEGDIYIIEPDPNQPHNDDLIIIMPEDSSSNKADTKSIKSQRSIRSQKSIKSHNSKKVRAKSVEPEKKRKLSIDSSYSRRSLSKLGLMKKLKDAKENIISTFTLSRAQSKKQLKKTPEEVKEITKVEAVSRPAAASGEPKYIHIPLKPPVGQHDEYSYLDNEPIAATLIDYKPSTTEEPKVETKEKELNIDSPTSPKTDDVQFIFLTPPSDDEILDGPEIPETPSSESNFFEKDELKSIAKGAVDKVSPDKTLELIEEKNPDDEEQITKLPIKLVVDEEDGLAISKQETTTAKEVKGIKDELKSSLKTDSPILKKKVSFKRRSRDDSKDGGIYEDVKTPEETKKEQNEKMEREGKNMLAGGQSMSVDEEKSYLDQKIMKSTSLEEDFNKWSKLSDHEYEPINPPPEIVSTPAPVASSTVHVIDSEQMITKPISIASSTTSLERRMLAPPESRQPEESFTSLEMQLEFEERFASAIKQSSPALSSAGVDDTSKTKQPGKIQQIFKDQAGKFKTKLHGIKKPNIKLPNRPKFEKPNFKFETPKFNFPKIPDTSKINLPSFNFPRKSNNKKSLKQRQYSTESNAGGTKTHYFDFSTYPRMFRKKQPPRDDFSSSFSSKSDPEPLGMVVPEFATVPRTNKRIKNNENDRWGGRDSIRIPLHGDSMEAKEPENEEVISKPKHEKPEQQQEEEPEVSHIRYESEIDIDDAYEKENQQIHTASPFSHDYNSRWNHGSFHPEPACTLEFKETFRNQQITDLDSPEDGPTRDESFEINTSKDIHSSESSLGIHRRGVLEEIDSDEFFLRQKGISQDNIEVGAYLSSEIREAFKSPGNALSDLSYAAMASNQSLPETPTKRKQVKKPKRKKTPHVSQEEMPYQDSEPELDDSPPLRPRRKSKRSKKRDTEVIPYQETIPVEDVIESNTQLNLHQRLNEYENEEIEGKEIQEHEYEEEEEPSVPPRKHRSLKSLDLSEHGSILGERHFEEEEFEPPVKPPRTLSRSSSKSFEYSSNEQPPVRPMRTRSHSRTRSRAESLSSVQPCLEEPCTLEFRDYMGYSTIDKTKREPPLPPSTPRKKKSTSSEKKFFTIPRKQIQEKTPVRPLRNYSTLGPSRPPRKKNNLTDEEKHQESLVDITQYIEIEEEPNRDLHSGEVIQKMKDRPLPAPPRPPRKSRTHDNTPEVEDFIEKELEIETQTEEIKKEEKEQTKPTVLVERRLITPTSYSYEEETITHGSLVVEPLNGAKILPDSELTRIEKTIPITKDYDSEEIEDSEIPEEFHRLKAGAPENQPQKIEINPEVEVLKAQKLLVSDLDVDRLSVNELLASKIVVSEIESGSIQTNDINSRTGALKVGEIELPSSLVQQLFERLQVAAQEQVTASVAAVAATVSPPEQKIEESEQKKTPFEQVVPVIHTLEKYTHETTPPVEPQNEEKSYHAIPDPPKRSEASTNVTPPEPGPQRPPRQRVDTPEEPEVDDKAPPRPPHPEVDYIPSQPPASFYALRAQQFVDTIDDDIPMPPRRRRHHKAHPIPESSSDDDSPIVPPPSRRRVRSPEPSIPQLTGQLIQACGTAANCTIKRLMTHITNVLQNSDGRQDLHVIMLILLILIAGLILLGFGNGKTVHYHHWEYFNPPRDM